MRLKFSTIASCSNGNCTYIGSDYTNILIDAGLSGKRIEAGLDSLGLDGTKIDAIFVTHEHADHVNGIGVLSRKFGIPIYATDGTWNNMPSKVGEIRPDLMHSVYEEEPCILGDIFVKPFTIPHDAAQPVGYCIENDSHKITVATDIGHITECVLDHLKGSEIMLLESNHDPDMVRNGPYPYPLQQRILGKKGHLSNSGAADVLNSVCDEKTKYVFLGHLSKENNTPILAYNTVKNSLSQNGAEIGKDFNMWVAPYEGVYRKIVLDR